MTIPAGVVLFCVIWFMLLFIILPLRMQSQDEAGSVVPGTPSSAPHDAKMKKKFIWVTIISVIVFVPLAWVISSGVISIHDIDFFRRMDGS